MWFFGAEIVTKKFACKYRQKFSCSKILVKNPTDAVGKPMFSYVGQFWFLTNKYPKRWGDVTQICVFIRNFALETLQMHSKRYK